MRYEVVLDPNAEGKAPILVDVKELPSGELEVEVNGRRVPVDLAVLERELSLRIDGQVIDLVTEGELPELGMIAFGQRAYVRVTSDRLRAAMAAKSDKAGAGERVLKSPMPGRVVKVLVAEGDQVKQGQGLIIVEAMKMENELKAKSDGTVASVHVKATDTVEGGAKLITLA